jgi:hypothetical protein
MIKHRFDFARFAVLFAVAGMMTPRAAHAIPGGTLLTNFVSASFQLPSGSPGLDVEAGKNNLNLANSQTAWVLITDSPQLCLKLWKQATTSVGLPLTAVGVPPLPEVFPQTDFVCFTISFSNCGGYSGFSVMITDVMPANTVRGAAIGGSGYIQGAGTITPTWASTLAGPWLGTPPMGQVGPLYLRWLLSRVGMNKTGFVRYCLTVL